MTNTRFHKKATGAGMWNTAVLILSLFITIQAHSHSAAAPVVIKTQEQFDEAIREINRGIESNLVIKRGTYELNSNITATAPLRITGKNARIIANSHVYQKDSAIDVTVSHYRLHVHPRLGIYSLFTDNNGNIVNVSESVDTATEVNVIDDLILGDSINKKNTNIAIPISGNLKHLRNKTFSRAYGYVDCGWSKIDFVVNRSDDRYFHCTTLNSTNIPSINYDKTVYKKGIRYVIYNAELKEGSIFYDNDYIYIPKTHKVVRCLESNGYNQGSPCISAQSDFVLDGITMEGGNGIRVRSKEQDSGQITNCTFLNVLGSVITIQKANNAKAVPLTISHCNFRDCSLLWGNVISLNSNQAGHPCISVECNRFLRSSISQLKNCNETLYINADGVVQENTFRNASRCHIFVSKGEVEIRDNAICNTREFLIRQRNRSNDYGLIYCGFLYTNSRLAIEDTTNIIRIENNLLYGSHAYANDARGIMIDDGRGNVHCTGNLILDTQMYSIDSREVKNFIGTSSIRNSFSNNFVDNRYRLQSGEDVPQTDLPLTDNNIILGDIENVTKKVISRRKDEYIVLDNAITFDEDKVFISKELYNSLRTKEGFNKIKKFIKVGKPSR